MNGTGKGEQAPPLWECPPNAAQRGSSAEAFPRKLKPKHNTLYSKPIQAQQALGKLLIDVLGRRPEPWTALLFPPAKTPLPRAPRHLGSPGEDPGTSSPMDGPRRDKTSAPKERAAATGPSLALGPGFLPPSGPLPGSWQSSARQGAVSSLPRY